MVSFHVGDEVDYGTKKKLRRGTVIATQLSSTHGTVYDIMNHANDRVDKGQVDVNMKLVYRAGDSPLVLESAEDAEEEGTEKVSPRVSTRARSSLARRSMDRTTPLPSTFQPLQVNRSKIERHGPDSYLITDWLSKEDADRQLAAWEKLASQFRLMKHRGNPLARYKAFYCDPLAGSRTMYEYTSSELETWEEHEWPPEGLLLRDAVRDTLSEDVNSLVANDYRDKKHKITWHFDKPADIAHDTSIATVSLGHARLFQLCPIAEVKHWMDAKKKRTERMKRNRQLGIKKKLPSVAPLGGVIDVALSHGSIFIIGPETNETFMHCIPPSTEKCGRRYGLTFRTIASRWLPDVEVVIRQPPKGKTAWDVVHRPTQPRQGVSIGQNGYAYRARVHLQPYTPLDPTRLTEEDIIAVRQSMPSRTKTAKRRPSRTEDSGSEDSGSEDPSSDDGSSSEEMTSSEDEDDNRSGKQERKGTKRRYTKVSADRSKKRQR